tara:strand:+ start:24 stop:947 length:924 start_codon:yes stop_codon:yes gene_type:complete
MNESYIEKEILDLKKLFLSLFKEKKLIISCTTLFAVFSIFYALSITNTYSSDAKLIATAELEVSQNRIDIGGGGLGGFAGLVSSSSLNTDPRTKLAKELLTSIDFINEFVFKRNILIPLMAGESWNQKENKIDINKNIYDEKTKKWLRKATFLFDSAPSKNEVFNKFSSNFEIKKNKDGITTISLSSLSPHVSKSWLTWIIDDVNEEIRKKEISSSQQRINFLLNELKFESVTSTKEAISSVLKSEYSKLMLANTQKDYAYTIIDPPNLATNREGTPRSIICILITTLGFFLSLLIVILKNYIKFFK